MLKDRINWISIGIFFLGIMVGGILLISIKKLEYFHIHNQISLSLNPFEVLSVSINVFLAIYVTSTLSKRNEQEKFSKQFLVNSLDEFNKDFRKNINQFIDKEEYDTVNVRTKFKSLRIKLSSLLKIATDNQLLDNNNDNIVSTKMTEMWELFTESPRVASSRASKAIKEEIEYLRFQKLLDIEKKHVEFEEAMFNIILKINKK